MKDIGIVIKDGISGTRIGLRCPHQDGLLYVVPAEASWVCSSEFLAAHAISGFFGELCRLGDSKIVGLMQQWGIYFRERPLEQGDIGESSAPKEN